MKYLSSILWLGYEFSYVILGELDISISCGTVVNNVYTVNLSEIFIGSYLLYYYVCSISIVLVLYICMLIPLSVGLVVLFCSVATGMRCIYVYIMRI